MESKNRLSNKLWCLFLILCITKVCHGQLMCYVCENCPEVTAETPKFECNEEYFNTAGTTESSVQTTTEGLPVDDSSTSTTTTTTELPTNTDESSSTTETTETTPDTTTESTTNSTTESTTDSTTQSTTDSTTQSTTESTTESTTDSTTDSTTESTTETTTDSTTVDTTTTTTEDDDTTTETITSTDSTTTTEALPPTPPTVGPPPTTTVIPTPPNPGAIQPIDDVEKLNSLPTAHDQNVDDDEVDGIAVEYASSTKAYQPSAAFRIRQLRAVGDTYHCFKVQAFNENSTMITNRGCSRVATMEAVCTQWQEKNPLQKLNKCYPCSTTKCNGSTTLNVSITAMFVALIAVFMHRK